MKQDVLKQAAEYSQEHRRRRRRHRVLSALAMVMVFCTVYTLIMPALTLEGRGAPLCGIEEHVHTEECYGGMELTCGLEEVSEEEAANGHVHTDECYELVPAQPCELPEGEGHTHTDECYETRIVTVGHELICDQWDDPEHVHTDECFTPAEDREEKILVCGQDEYEPHTHTAECLEPEAEKVLVCELEEVGPVHVHTEECYTPILICGKAEHTHTEECWVEEFENEDTPTGEDPYTELERTVDSMGYRAVFHAVYFGELAEGDELDFTATTDEDFESDRASDYYMAIGERTTLPGGYTSFEMTLNGEPVDRAQYEVMVEIIPSRYMVAGLYQTAASTLETLDLPDTMDLTDEDYENEPAMDEAEPVESAEPVVDAEPVESAEPVVDEAEPVVDETEPVVDETEPVESAEPVMDEAEPEPVVDETEAEPEEHTHSHTFVGFMAYELEEGELAIRGSMEVDLSALEDMDAYMAEAFDEEGNSVYDETYAFNIQPLEQDFMFAAGVAEDPIEELSNYDQKYYDARVEVWWDEYQITTSHWGGTTYSRVSPDHVKSVTLTHSTQTGEKLPGTDGKIVAAPINQGNSDAPMKPGGTQLGGSTTEAWVECDASEATRITVNYQYKTYYGTENDSDEYIKGSANASDWNNALNAKEKDLYWKKIYRYYDAYITSVKYEKQVTITTPAIYPNATTRKMDYAVLEITPEQGYYVTDVLIACVHSGHRGGNYDRSSDGLCPPWDCGIYTSGQAFTRKFNVSEGTKASVVVPSEAFAHGDYNDLYKRCYIMVRTAAIPAPLFVKYEPGMIGNTNVTTTDSIFTNGSTQWLDGTGRTTGTGSNIAHDGVADKLTKTGNGGTSWANSDLSYTTAGISDDAAAAARAKGYRFAGWRLEYYNEAYLNGVKVNETHANVTNFKNVTFNNLYGVNPGTIPANGKVDLTINAKLIAQWEAIPAAEVTKTVRGLEADENGIEDSTVRSYQFELRDANGNLVQNFKTEELRLEEVDGKFVYVPYEVNGTNPFTITVTGNSSSAYKIYGLTDGATYTVTEVGANGEGFKTTYKGNTFTVNNSGDAQEVVVVNDYSTAIETFDITIEKVTPATSTAAPAPEVETETIEDNEIPQSATAPGSKWSALSGAHFDLYEQKKDENGDVLEGEDGWSKVNGGAPIVPTTDGNGKVAAAVKSGLKLDTLYKLVETKAPAGYNKLTTAIYFKVLSETNEFILCNPDGTKLNDKNADKNAHAMALGEGENKALTLVVANYGGFVLPSTGGTGTYVYALGGALLMAAAVILMYMSRKRAGGYAA